MNIMYCLRFPHLHLGRPLQAVVPACGPAIQKANQGGRYIMQVNIADYRFAFYFTSCQCEKSPSQEHMSSLSYWNYSQKSMNVSGAVVVASRKWIPE